MGGISFISYLSFEFVNLTFEIFDSLLDLCQNIIETNNNSKSTIPKSRATYNLQKYDNFELEQNFNIYNDLEIEIENKFDEKWGFILEDEIDSIEVIRKEYQNVSDKNNDNQEIYIKNSLYQIKEFGLNKLSLQDYSNEKVIIPYLSNHKYTICFDLDETLIHSDFDHVYNNPDYIFEGFIEDKWGKLQIFIRPNLNSVLKNLSRVFELILFTSSKKEYADRILSLIDPEKNFFSYRLYRENCVDYQGFKLKDLRVIANRNIENLILVDNNLISMSPQLKNGFLISSFYYDKKDLELLFLQRKLIQINNL